MMLREDGFTLIELLVAIVVMAVGVLSLVGVLEASGRLTQVSERQSSLIHRAQLELERVEALPYTQVAMTGSPSTSTDPANPDYYVNGNGTFQYDRGNPAKSEAFAVDATNGAISPNPVAWSDGRLSGNVYDFVTWTQDPNCNNGTNCSATQDYKRVVVAITLTGATHPSQPVLVSTLIADPNAAPNGYVVNGVQNPLQSPSTMCGSPPAPCTNGLQTGTPVTWFLYDTSTLTFNGTLFAAYNTTRQPISGNHPTHPTIAVATPLQCQPTLSVVSGCQNPDLMGSSPPPQDGSTPATPYCYSSDIGCSGSPPIGATSTGGRTLHRDVACSVAPTTTDETKGAFWVTNALAANTTLTGDGGMTLHTETASGTVANVTVCVGIYNVPASLLTLSTTPPTRLGVVAYTSAAWPNALTPVSFHFNFLGAGNTSVVPAGNRIGVRIWIDPSSSDDVTLVYDHPSFVSELELNEQ